MFGEGVQKFPKSIKAEMYYELSKSLKEMNKLSEACKTLEYYLRITKKASLLLILKKLIKVFNVKMKINVIK